MPLPNIFMEWEIGHRGKIAFGPDIFESLKTVICASWAYIVVLHTPSSLTSQCLATLPLNNLAVQLLQCLCLYIFLHLTRQKVAQKIDPHYPLSVYFHLPLLSNRDLGYSQSSKKWWGDRWLSLPSSPFCLYLPNTCSTVYIWEGMTDNLQSFLSIFGKEQSEPLFARKEQ